VTLLNSKKGKLKNEVEKKKNNKTSVKWEENKSILKCEMK
jgi:hypothetical protein